MTREQDAQAVRQVLAGDRQAFRILIESHEARVHNLLRRLVRDPDQAEDLAQEAFLRAYRKLDRFDTSMSFSNWIMKIAQNLAFTWLKRQGVGRERLVLDGPDDRGADQHPDTSPLSNPEDVVEQRAMADLARGAMDRLPEKYRLILTLRYTEELSYQDIAEMLEIPLGTVKFRLYQAHRLLTEAMTRFGVVPT